MVTWKDLDAEPLSPIDYGVESWQRQVAGGPPTDGPEFYHYTHLDPQNILFPPFEFLLDHGAIDMIIDRRQLRDEIGNLLAKLDGRPNPLAAQ